MVPGIFSGCKGGRCVGLTTLPPSCADCLEIWEPEPLEPSGPVQACNGIALPLHIVNFTIYVDCKCQHNWYIYMHSTVRANLLLLVLGYVVISCLRTATGRKKWQPDKVKYTRILTF